MKRALKVMLALAICASMVGIVRGQMEQAKEPTLKVGDAAPALAGGKWVKGDAVDKFQNGKIYVVEFWATWCGPCVAAIPHVTEMQKKYEKDGVTFIGQNVWENDQSAVEPFVQKMAEKMDYRVRMDDLADGGRGKMAATWMEAAGQNGIPCSFLIGKDGKIAWIGHPMELESVLKDVIAGTFDPKKAEADKAALEQAGKDLEKAMGAGDFDGALKILDGVEKQRPDMAGQIHGLRFSIQLQKKDYDGAYKSAAKFGEAMNDNAAALNEVAWTIVDAPGLEKRDLDLAEKLATRSVELTERKESQALDTLARIQFEKGQVDKAVATETEALGKADADSKPQIQGSLEKYTKAKSGGAMPAAATTQPG